MKITAKENQQIQIDYENELIKKITGKTAFEVFNEYSIPELNRLLAHVFFLKSI